MLEGVLNDSRYRENVLHCAVDASQKLFLKASVDDVVVQDEAL